MSTEKDDEEDEYLNECYICEAVDVDDADRWYFYDEDWSNTWLCRSCHSQFDSKEEFEEFREDIPRLWMYRACAGIQRLLLQGGFDDIVEADIDFLKDIAKDPGTALDKQEVRLNKLMKARSDSLKKNEQN